MVTRLSRRKKEQRLVKVMVFLDLQMTAALTIYSSRCPRYIQKTCRLTSRNSSMPWKNSSPSLCPIYSIYLPSSEWDSFLTLQKENPTSIRTKPTIKKEDSRISPSKQDLLKAMVLTIGFPSRRMTKTTTLRTFDSSIA